MQGIYDYVPETSPVSNIHMYNVTAVLWLQFVVQIMLFLKINLFYFYV